MDRRTFIISLGSVAIAGCGESARRDVASPTPAASPSATASPVPSPSPSPTQAPTREPTATGEPPAPAPEPFGFPLDPATRTGIVTGSLGSRVIRWGEGPQVLDFSRDDQPSDDPVRANAAGWNARTHFEYEGQPAVDWYVPTGTPVVATMDGLATLLINTVSNPFDFYRVPREPYIGNPDRSRAPFSPFPGPGGGQGVYVRVENRQFRTDYAHLEIGQTLRAVPRDTHLAGYSATFQYSGAFAEIRDFRVAAAIAAWEVRKGQVIGFTGDSGYSEAPHLHYAIRPASGGNALCPTAESGFEQNGWLFRS